VTDEVGFDFQVICPNRVVLRERVTSLVVPGARGAVGFWAGHAPMLVSLSPGVVRFRPAEGGVSGARAADTRTGAAGADFRTLAVGGGFFEMSPDGGASLLADTAELPEEIDVGRAQAAYERARKRLTRPTPSLDLTRADIALQRALARLKAVGRPAS